MPPYQVKSSPKRWITPFIGLCALVGFIAIIRSLFSPEPLSDDQILAKNKWTKEEISTVLARPKRPSRKAHRHLNTFIRKLSKTEQKTVFRSVIHQRIQSFKEKMALVSDEQKEDISKKLLARAKQERQKLDKLTDAQRKKTKDRMNQNDMQQMSQQLGQEIINTLSPDERRLIAPAITEWTHAIESL